MFLFALLKITPVGPGGLFKIARSYQQVIVSREYAAVGLGGLF